MLSRLEVTQFVRKEQVLLFLEESPVWSVNDIKIPKFAQVLTFSHTGLP